MYDQVSKFVVCCPFVVSAQLQQRAQYCATPFIAASGKASGTFVDTIHTCSSAHLLARDAVTSDCLFTLSGLA